MTSDQNWAKMRNRLVLFIFLFILHGCLAANPVKIPIIKGKMDVHTRKFAKLPNEFGEEARILCMVPFRGKLYVCTLTKIYVVDGQGKHSLFLDVGFAVKKSTGRSLNIENRKHGGVRSVAFHRNFNKFRTFYVAAMENRPKNKAGFTYISDVSNHIKADSVLIEFKVPKNSGKGDPTSYRNVFRVGMPVFDHPIKQIAFRGRFLYIAHGDGSVQSAIAGGGQKNDALGKILRISPLKSGSKPYSIPRTNPFVNKKNMKSEVWALGFRNPHHICFGNDGTLYVADAGRSNVEEINLVKPGKNYGWSKREGTFVHSGGGLISGIKSLPGNDAKFGFEYPAAQVGHDGPFRAGFIGQAIAGGCPVENGSPLSGFYFYADFPESGKLFYSKISELKQAKTSGNPKQLTQARTGQADVIYEGKRYKTLGDVLRSEPKYKKEKRVDVRFGRGPRGELYWSSKKNGRIYLITSSLKGGKGGPK